MSRSPLLIPLLALATLAGCATVPVQREDTLAQMTRECSERGGMLTPISGAVSGNERANYACEIHGGGGRVR